MHLSLKRLIEYFPALETPGQRKTYVPGRVTLPFLCLLSICCMVPVIYFTLGLNVQPFHAHHFVPLAIFAVIHGLARRTFFSILFLPILTLAWEPYYIHLILYPITLLAALLYTAPLTRSIQVAITPDELFIPSGCVITLLVWSYRSGQWAPLPAAMAMLLIAAVLYLKFRMRGLEYCLGYSCIAILLLINVLSANPSFLTTVVVILFPCVILIDMYVNASRNTGTATLAPASDQKLMLLAEISEKIREPLFLLNSALPGLRAGDEKKLRDIDTNINLLMQLSQNVMKIVETEGANQLVDEAFNLRTLIEDAIDIVSRGCLTDLEFIYSIDQDINLDLVGDQGVIRQVLIELLNYCVKHTPAGEIRLAVSLLSLPGEGNATDLSFRIINSGFKGPNSEVLPLSYCYQLLRLLKSQLITSSSSDELRFQFDLHLALSAVATEPEDYAFVGSGSVLVLEHHKSTRDWIMQELSAMGFHVEGAGDKTDAKRLLQLGVTSVLPYDFILVDNRIDGIEFIVQLLAETDFATLTPILMLCPSDRSRIEHIHAIAPQIRHMLQKPIRRSALLQVFKTILSARSTPSLPISRSLSGLPVIRKKKEVARRTTRVLVADDGLPAHAIIRELFSNLGFQASFFSEPATFVKEALSGAYAAALVNVSTKKFNPFQLVQEVRNEEKTRTLDLNNDDIPSHLPVIAATDSPSEQEKQQCFEAAMDGYIAKPIDADLLDSILRDLQVFRSSTKKRSSNSPAPPRLLSPSSPLLHTPRQQGFSDAKLWAYVPKEFQELIAPNKTLDQVQLGDAELRCITIFFSDIRDFTQTTEKMYVKDVMKFINAYLAFALPAITTHHGFVDKFIGDAIMAIFAHVDLKEQAVAAVSAAVKMQRDLDFMHACGFREATTGIGINTGPVIMGFIGTETRMSPTVLGDAVNLASRTEALCKTYGARVLITQHTLRQMAEKAKLFDIRPVDHVTVKGKEEPCKIYEVINGDSDELRSKKLRILGDYNRAMDYFSDGKFELALDLFESCSKMLSSDKPSLLYISRCRQLIANPPISWDGIYHRTEKD